MTESLLHRLLRLPFLAWLTLVVILLATFPIQDYDTFWHLAYGRAMVESGQFINHEIFSYTAAGQPLGSHSQLAQVLYWLAWAAAGANGVILLKLAVLLAVAGLLLRLARVAGADLPWAAFCAAFTLFVAHSRLSARPQVFSYLCLVLLVLLLQGYRQRGWPIRSLWALPLLMIVWDYLHGTVYGLVYGGAFLAGETLGYLLARRGQLASLPPALDRVRLRPLWILAGATLLAMLLHPNGLLDYSGFWRVLGNSETFKMYGEWASPTWADFPAFWIYFGLLALLVLFNLKRLALSDWLVLIPFTYLVLNYNRAVMAFMIVSLPVFVACARRLAERLPPLRNLAPRWSTLACVLAFAVITGFTVEEACFRPGHYFAFGTGVNENIFPVGSVRFVAENGLSGNLYNMDGFGGYLAFSLAPERKIFHYNLPVVFDALPNFVHKPETRAQWEINYAIIGRKDELDMFKRDGFVPVYWEPTAMVLARPSGQNRSLLEQHRLNFFKPLLPPAQLRSMAAQPAIAPRLFTEWADYLAYRGDPELADLLGELLLESRLAVPPAVMAKRLTLALRHNPASLTLAAAQGVYLYRTGDVTGAKSRFETVRQATRDPELAGRMAEYLKALAGR